MVVQPAEQGPIPFGQADLDAQDGVIHGASRPTGDPLQEGLSELTGTAVTVALTCVVSAVEGSVRGSA
ncbi:hypothetical protein GCM10007977_046810 [Dactylosporangium sucinum]|uniref:Uncharacterized protein n=1 Tax=Dactylosporangium sucinum TaxID=1424081 RepID=A0A917TVP1_9ACTN|nr:hypothetical protein GCM10007977_046810 [Dactylosporangium sucinum]